MQPVPLRRIVALVAALLAGALLQTAGLGATSVVVPRGDSAPAGAPESVPAAVEAGLDPILAPALPGRTWASASTWSWVTAQAITTLIGLVALLVAAAWLALRARSGSSWLLARAERARATTRRSSPLAARRAPPARTGC